VNAGLAAVLTLITESVRQNKVLEFKTYLAEVGFSASRADLLFKLLDNVNNATLLGLKSVQTPLPRVVDANWSLTYTDKVKIYFLIIAIKFDLRIFVFVEVDTLLIITLQLTIRGADILLHKIQNYSFKKYVARDE